jgi:hypothetical protein
LPNFSKIGLGEGRGKIRHVYVDVDQKTGVGIKGKIKLLLVSKIDEVLSGPSLGELDGFSQVLVPITGKWLRFEYSCVYHPKSAFVPFKKKCKMAVSEC